MGFFPSIIQQISGFLDEWEHFWMSPYSSTQGISEIPTYFRANFSVYKKIH